MPITSAPQRAAAIAALPLPVATSRTRHPACRSTASQSASATGWISEATAWKSPLDHIACCRSFTADRSGRAAVSTALMLRPPWSRCRGRSRRDARTRAPRGARPPGRRRRRRPRTGRSTFRPPERRSTGESGPAFPPASAPRKPCAHAPRHARLRRDQCERRTARRGTRPWLDGTGEQHGPKPRRPRVLFPTVADQPRGELRPRANPELRVDVPEVVLDRVHGDDELLCDLLVREPLGGQVGDAALRRRELACR